ncbi:YdeI/OmpD-associated family protein [Massilia sp. P8910]|uniref:YdeI/OmpD-associated family protein n=1 Tax=Massilia antarctica TaxID=2765360 RepID=UPI0006BB723D|nr:YdeI/OmpD-associated family protein [Massilia antarctica]MCY0913907.1 YdeI/OmpD-associated family protein [Massilia sp. H27-R4]CUI04360.1 putative periplasmic membrane protein [Janthinobacterium sp. CG23_2]CUU28146.1 putative periplasmic membrane protein [Janthinobacterium sp. CG23_2]
MGETTKTAPAPDDTPRAFASQAAWAQWLAEHHASSRGVWLRHAKKGAPQATVTYQEALEVALCFGWIDGQKRSEDQHHWLQRWTPRAARSIWSRVNRDKALGFIAEGKMQPAGLAEVERAQQDGRWDAAYEPASAAQVPPDLEAAFDAHPGAREFFATLNGQNRYAVLFRIQTAVKPDTRARRIATYAAMLARGETLHPLMARKT